MLQIYIVFTFDCEGDYLQIAFFKESDAKAYIEIQYQNAREDEIWADDYLIKAVTVY